MATLALAVAGAAVGSALLPAGLTVLGATITGATIGAQVGALAGSYIDQTLLAGSGPSRVVGGPRLDDLRVTASTEGAPIPRLVGRQRLGGQVIWASELEERVASNGSGKGGIGGPAGPKTYRYYANFAVALAEGPVTSIGRVWADGKELDLNEVTWRLHAGSDDQVADALIVSHLGADDAPAYRGTAYIVFEHMLLEPYGNRLPQLSFEVFRAVDPFDQSIRGVVMIPGSGEFVYSPTAVTRDIGAGQREGENSHTLQGATDWSVSLDQLAATLPNAYAVSLVVSWFGSDLRAGDCLIRPAVDSAEKATKPLTWSVAGLTRATAPLVSANGGRAAYGGTPSDSTVIAAIRDLETRGHAVTLNPFVLMDVPAGNVLPNPYAPAEPQAAYPWRGRITIHPAPGVSGSPDKTAAAAAQLASFMGTAAPSDFTVTGDTVIYTGPDEWSFRRFILHYAHLAVAAGGVDGFILCSELRGLTQARGATSSYPFVDALVALAADVRSVLGPSTRITYGADWSEYFGHQPADGSGDVHFHLDPLWASPVIDAIGVDAYWSLADWRDGRAHADWLAGHRSIYDLDYLRTNIRGGEGFDWYYATAADRDAQIRTPITDGAGKPWVFRPKDIRSWWLEPHYDRPGGVESPTPTAWVPQSKPFWLTEIGCPAIDKGANQPNVFVDPKSAENATPYYSNAVRDDHMQRRYLQALIDGLDPAHPGYVEGANPSSSVYGGPMIDLANVYVYAWDARPYPAFPSNLAAWGDGGSWQLGHWLNGRIASQPLSEAIRSLFAHYGFTDVDTGKVQGVVAGYVVDRIMSAREALQPLMLAFFLDAIESGGRIVLRHRGAEPPILALTPDAVVEARPGADLISITRAQETDLPASARIAYASYETDYRQAVAEARRLVGASGRVALAELAVVMEAGQATAIAESWLFETWAARERARFTLPPSLGALEPGDVVALAGAAGNRLFRLTEIGDHGAREIDAIRIEPDIYIPIAAPPRPQEPPPGVQTGSPLVRFLDLPLLRGDEPPDAGYIAATMRPWPGGVAVFRSPTQSDFVLGAIIAAPAIMGTTVDTLPVGPTSRLDKATRQRVVLDGGALASVGELVLFSGANAAAIEHAPGRWEVVQFERAELVAPATYELSRLVRGQAGSEWAATSPLAAGARFVILDAALTRIDLAPADVGLAFNWRHGPSNRDIGASSYETTVHAFTAVGRRPLAPVHLRVRRIGTDLHLSWIRRTRMGGDSWEGAEVPLGEESERYEIDVLDGAAVKRTIATTVPATIYTTADQLADFGSPQPTVSLRIHQIGAAYGRGSALSAMA